MAGHSILSASGAHRWLNCTASIKACEGIPDNTSEDAQKGTEVHELCAYKLAKLLGRNVQAPEFQYSVDDERNAQCYAEYVNDLITETCSVFIEQKVDFSEFSAEGAFGTADCIIVDDTKINIIDYKNGIGVKVDALKNPQMMLYALGAYATFRDVYENISEVTMTIYQPNIENVSTYTVSLQELLDVAEEVFKPKAQEALSGDGVYNKGEWCRFCKAKATCKKYSEEFMEILKDFEKVGETEALTEDEILVLLRHGDAICSWIKEVKEYALNCAKLGKKWTGFELRAGRSVRKFTDESAVAETLRNIGVEPYENVSKLKTLTALEKELGKKKVEELLGTLLIKVPGKETLVAKD
ncbi:MAG: DUF2800 domain-containing protein [Succinivibrio sp.]